MPDEEHVPEGAMIYCENLVKIYQTDEIEVVALQGLDLTVQSGELLAVIGNSGSGKSTLLNMLGGLDRPSAGKVFVDGKNLLKLRDEDLVTYRRETVGFVWQNTARNIIPYLTAQQNVELPMLLSGRKRRDRAEMLLDSVGLSHRRNARLEQLSGGEQQRLGIAISLSNEPSLLLADEPTGSVDTRTADQVLGVLRDMNTSFGVTILIVTHDRRISRMVDRVVAIRDGRTSSEFVRRQSYARELAEMEDHELSQDGIGPGDESHIELAVLDRTGRLQIPAEYLDAIGYESGRAGRRIKVELEQDRIVLLNPEDADQDDKGEPE
jgi:ABC-type lipoprotein export system ATPase subunit